MDIGCNTHSQQPTSATTCTTHPHPHPRIQGQRNTAGCVRTVHCAKQYGGMLGCCCGGNVPLAASSTNRTITPTHR